LEAIGAQAGPFPGGSIIAQYLVFRAARDAGFKVLLGGQGGDEAFMGYSKFQVFRFLQLLAEKRYVGALSFAISCLPTLIGQRTRWSESWNRRRRYLNRAGLDTVLSLPDSETAIGYRASDTLRSRQILDVTLASLPTLLRYEDSNSMANSIESRLPFVDYRVIEFGVALPEVAKLCRGYGKWIVRQAMIAKIPEAIRTDRLKKGFNVQESRWISEGLGDFIRKLLHERAKRTCRWLMPHQEIDSVFSNKCFQSRPSAFAEATTLLWLSHATEDREL
jgi:asparagine synthase (glutamine-hydrolysing)